MRSRYRVHEPDRAHFITSTVVGWLPVFSSVPCCQILADSLAHCQRHKALKLHAELARPPASLVPSASSWVIMENHFHAIAQSPELSAMMADLKKFTARRLIEQLPQEGRDWLLRLLEENRARHKTASRYQLWQEGFHPQAILDDAMMLQSRAERDRLAGGQPRRVPPEGGINFDYLHHNPVRRGWVASPEHWRYSSAHEWLPGSAPLLRCDPWR